MFKKLLTSVLCIVLGLSVLAGCNLIQDNKEKDSLQVIVDITSINESGSDKHVLNTDGYYEYDFSDAFLDGTANSYYSEDTVVFVKDDNFFIKVKVADAEVYTEVYDVELSDLVKRTEDWTYSSGNRAIYKYQLNSYLNSYAQQYMQTYGYSFKEVTEFFVDQLIIRELVVISADKLVEQGEIRLDNSYKNTVSKGVYSQIDEQYKAILNTLLLENGEIVDQDSEEQPSAETKYPLYPYSQVSDAGEEPLWDITHSSNRERWPGMSGANKSLELEAMKRLVTAFEDVMKENYRLTKEEKAKYKEDFVRIKNIMNTKGVQEVYPMLMDTFTVNYLFTLPTEEDAKIDLMQKYVDRDAEVTDDEILAEYNRLLEKQIDSYRKNITNYYDAADEKLVLFNPEPDRFIYVKHILLQFSDEQKALLEAKRGPGSTEESYNAFREALAKEITAYERIDGEDNTQKVLSLDTIANDIRAKMAPLKNDPQSAEIMFDKLIYQYNQDPGAFQNPMGYAVIYKLGADEVDQWVPEFADAARKLREEFGVGHMLRDYVVTDHGIHFMYYCNSKTEEIVSINSKVTPAGYETMYDLLKEEVRSLKSADMFGQWQNETIHYYREIKGVATIHTKRFKDIYKDSE